MSPNRLLQPRSLATSSAIAGLTAAWLLCAACCFGQTEDPLPDALRRDAAMTPEKRAELQAILQRHAKVLEAQATVLKTVARLVGPAVVHVEAAVNTRPRSYRQIEENGSGVIIKQDQKFYVLTNRHVVHASTPKRITIHLADGRQIHPVEVWGDADTDVGVMAVDAPNLVAATIGDSDRMEIGDFVLAVGSPFDLRQSVTFGIISAKGRRDLQLGDTTVALQDFIQTDAAINPGNSGGPLVNLRGEVVAINTAIASNSGGNEGIGFAIPINMFMFFGRQLIERGSVTRAFLGVNLDASFGPVKAAEIGLPAPMGARITEVKKGTPAKAASLEVGDVILEFNHVPVDDDDHLVNLVSLTEVGRKVPLVIYRDHKSFEVEVEVGDRGKLRAER